MRKLGFDTTRPGLRLGANGLTAMGLGLAVLPLAMGMVGVIEAPLVAALGPSMAELTGLARSVAAGVVALTFLLGALVLVFALGAKPEAGDESR